MLACLLWLACVPVSAAPQGGGVIEGFVTTQNGTIRLGGAQVVLLNSSNREVSTVLSEGDGHFRFTALQQGKYALTASLDGFAASRAVVVVTSGATTDQSLDLPLATLMQTVEVKAPASIVSAASTLGATDSISSRETDEFAQRQRARRRAPPPRERDRSAGRRQHQGRPADASRRANRREHAHRSGARPRSLHAARRCDRFGRR